MLGVNALFPFLATCVLGIPLNCIQSEWGPGQDVKLHPHRFCIFIFTGCFLYWCAMRRPVSGSKYTDAFINESLSYLVLQLFLALIAFLCWCAVKQSIDPKPLVSHPTDAQIAFLRWRAETPINQFWLGIFYKCVTNKLSHFVIFELQQHPIYPSYKPCGIIWLKNHNFCSRCSMRHIQNHFWKGCLPILRSLNR